MTRLLLALSLAFSVVLFFSPDVEACAGGCGNKAAGGCGQAKAGGCGGCGEAQMAKKAPALKPPEGLPEGSAQVALKVDGMRCGGCALKIEQALSGIEGVVEADVTFAEGALVVYMPDKVRVDDLKKAIEKAGFKSEPMM